VEGAAGGKGGNIKKQQIYDVMNVVDPDQDTIMH